ncbi:MAG: zinc metallopeptidase [Oscillospiraceae bacterium]|nr:zinc metallopeptidase [Oscillospiraceae bacterium]
MVLYEEPVALAIMAVSVIIALAAQFGVKSAYAKYSKVRISGNLTGAQVARMMVERENAGILVVEYNGGKLSDHFDPRKNMIALSPEVFNGSTVAALGIAAHEAGHALQHSQGYAPIKIRNGLILPVARIGSTLSMPLVMLGIFASVPFLIDLGIIFFTAALAFQVITLPVEFNASRRAVSLLGGNSYLTESELKGAKKVLNAAAMTYVAAVVTSLLQLLRLLMLARRRR